MGKEERRAERSPPRTQREPKEQGAEGGRRGQFTAEKNRKKAPKGNPEGGRCASFSALKSEALTR